MTDEDTQALDLEVERSLRAHYGAMDPPDALWQRIERTVAADTSPARNRRHGWTGMGLAAACAAAAVALAWLVVPVLLQAPEAPVTTAGRADASVEVDAHALSSEFATYIASGRAPDVRTTSSGTLESWFSDRLERPPPAPHTASFMELAGGRLCQIKGLRMAAYMYDLGGRPVSVYVTAPDAVRFGPGPEPHFVGAFDSYGLATWRAGNWRYSVVADLPPAELVDVARGLAARG